ncbi:MAG TPA: amylo-alpha-1,6-glucosidase [Candidatus Paceibacterota bacterium]|nr:amylo-alpha-1,6-glucosidase [Candidatus Paceibacterota bacterium]
MTDKELWELGLKSIRELEAERGILASARNEAYGCIFGRDSLITSLSLLRVFNKTNDIYFLDLVGKILHNLIDLQGSSVNIESGEEPGKCIHEFRPDNHSHLTQQERQPWYVYPDNAMRNYDTVDATPLFLIALHKYLKARNFEQVPDRLLIAARAALQWILEYGDKNGDGFLDYQFHPERTHGGLRVQSWMDSSESVFFERNDAIPEYPIAPVEVQAYAFAALCAWSDYLAAIDPEFSATLAVRAGLLKKQFNAKFVIRHGKSISLASAIDGKGRMLGSARSSMAHTLWAIWRVSETDIPESVLESASIPLLVKRLRAPDLYVPSAGIRTLSSRSRHFNPQSYHNGSIWPHDTAIFAEGLENFGYTEEALRVRRSLVRSYTHFKTPIELFAYARGFREYRTEGGHGACRTQAWSAASILSTLSDAVHGENISGIALA